MSDRGSILRELPRAADHRKVGSAGIICGMEVIPGTGGCYVADWDQAEMEAGDILDLGTPLFCSNRHQ